MAFIGRPRLPDDLYRLAAQIDASRADPLVAALSGIGRIAREHGAGKAKERAEEREFGHKKELAEQLQASLSERQADSMMAALTRALASRGMLRPIAAPAEIPQTTMLPVLDPFTGMQIPGMSKPATDIYPAGARDVGPPPDVLLSQLGAQFGYRPRSGAPELEVIAPPAKPKEAGDIVLTRRLIEQLKPYADWSELENQTIPLRDWNAAMRGRAYWTRFYGKGGKVAAGLGLEERLRLEAQKAANAQLAILKRDITALPQDIPSLDELFNANLRRLKNQAVQNQQPSLREAIMEAILGAAPSPLAPVQEEQEQPLPDIEEEEQ
ncbi:MAG: hypothetical protein QME60_01270 [Verrucomicrobiota bacterium]|nr:hypothetical protein [Verrucomicrobiota bacterium]